MRDINAIEPQRRKSTKEHKDKAFEPRRLGGTELPLSLFLCVPLCSPYLRGLKKTLPDVKYKWIRYILRGHREQYRK